MAKGGSKEEQREERTRREGKKGKERKELKQQNLTGKEEKNGRGGGDKKGRYAENEDKKGRRKRTIDFFSSIHNYKKVKIIYEITE